jgi:hypothetical protein
MCVRICCVQIVSYVEGFEEQRISIFFHVQNNANERLTTLARNAQHNCAPAHGTTLASETPEHVDLQCRIGRKDFLGQRGCSSHAELRDDGWYAEQEHWTRVRRRSLICAFRQFSQIVLCGTAFSSLFNHGFSLLEGPTQ